MIMRWLAAWRSALRGDAGVLDYAITFTAVMILLSAVMQAALFFAARNSAISAAEQGVDTARAQGATIAQGDAAACQWATAVAHGFLRGPVCTGTGGVTVAVRVCGDAASLVPGFPVRVCEQAQGARERFTVP
jgi:hypothetical protein